MKTLPSGLAASLASGVTTLCHCWRLQRQDATVLAFTDHDADLTFGGDTYLAATGLSASAWAARLGLAVDTIDAAGALSDASLDEDDLARGLWDGAEVRLTRVDWSSLADRVELFRGTIGEVERGPLAFRAELRSLAHALNQPRGRVFGNLCDADLGDERCTVDLSQPAFSTVATVSAVLAARSEFTTVLGFAAGWCKRGKVTWTSGANDGAAMEVKRHLKAGSVTTIELVEELPFDIDAGNAFLIEAGCDKTSGTCFGKFANIENHRGFPFMPGNDWITRYPNRGDGNDGGKL